MKQKINKAAQAQLTKLPVIKIPEFNFVPLKNVQVQDTYIPEYTGNKMYYILITSPAAIPMNRPFYLSNFPQIEEKEIIGIETYFEDLIPPVTINGVVYNIINSVDIAHVMVSFYDKENEPILYRVPLIKFLKFGLGTKPTIELPDYANLKIDVGKSFLESTSNTWFSTFPIAIPLNFYY